MKKFMVVSGFLGAGKTTFMLVLADYINLNNGKASVIVNDLGAKILWMPSIPKPVAARSRS